MDNSGKLKLLDQLLKQLEREGAVCVRCCEGEGKGGMRVRVRVRSIRQLKSEGVGCCEGEVNRTAQELRCGML